MTQRGFRTSSRVDGVFMIAREYTRSAQVGALVLGLLRTLASALDSYDDGEDQEDVLAATSELVSTFVELHVPRISQRPDFPVRGAARNMTLNLTRSRRWRRRDVAATPSTRPSESRRVS